MFPKIVSENVYNVSENRGECSWECILDENSETFENWFHEKWRRAEICDQKF